MDTFASAPRAFADIIGTPAESAELIYSRVRDRLRDQPVEDYRIDFEDGYGTRPDAEEDAHVTAAAREVAFGARDGILPRFVGIRVKPLTEESKARSTRTLRLFLRTLAGEDGASPMNRLRLTLPKVTVPEQVSYFGELLQELESELGLGERALSFEIMVETPQLIVGSDGGCPLPIVIAAGNGRISAAHFGTYDYSAACGIAAQYQRMRHDACQHALRVMQAALAGTGVWLSDGSTTLLPVPVHRTRDGEQLSAEQARENAGRVHAAWRLHYDDVRHSLASGFYQGWDLHPAQLPTRYAALFSFFLEGLDVAAARLRNFVERAAQATLVGDVFDDAATGQGLLNYFLRAMNAGAVAEQEVVTRTGLTRDELASRSFVKILNSRAEGRGP